MGLGLGDIFGWCSWALDCGFKGWQATQFWTPQPAAHYTGKHYGDLWANKLRQKRFKVFWNFVTIWLMWCSQFRSLMSSTLCRRNAQWLCRNWQLEALLSVKSQRQDNCDVSPLKCDGELHSGSQSKADMSNHQFSFVFTTDDVHAVTVLEGPSIPLVANLNMCKKRVAKLLREVDPSKLAGLMNYPTISWGSLLRTLHPYWMTYTHSHFPWENCQLLGNLHTFLLFSRKEKFAKTTGQ